MLSRLHSSRWGDTVGTRLSPSSLAGDAVKLLVQRVLLVLFVACTSGSGVRQDVAVGLQVQLLARQDVAVGLFHLAAIAHVAPPMSQQVQLPALMLIEAGLASLRSGTACCFGFCFHCPSDFGFGCRICWSFCCNFGCCFNRCFACGFGFCFCRRFNFICGCNVYCSLVCCIRNCLACCLAAVLPPL